MSKKDISPRDLEQLEADMEVAFRGGDIGLTALRAWEVGALFPANSATARIYIKKILRDAHVSSISLDAFKKNAKELREADELEDLAKLSALGLLRFPAERYLSLSLLEAAQRLSRTEWLQPIIDSLGTPADDDIVLLNVVASHENILGNYDKAACLFEKLRKLAPSDEIILQNYSASLAGLERYDDAIVLLEDHLARSDEPREYLNRLLPLYRLAGRSVELELNRLDADWFAACDNAQNARVHADLRLFLGDVDGAVVGLERLLGFGRAAGPTFELAELQLLRNELEVGLEAYASRFEAYPALAWYQSNAKQYKGQTLGTESLFVWAEQGIGDEIIFAMFLEIMVPKVKRMVVAMDPRLVPYFTKRYPHWRFVNRRELPGDLPAFDYACPLGDLMCLFLREVLDEKRVFSQPTIEPDTQRYNEIVGLLGQKSRPRIAISWRGGVNVSSKIRSLELGELLAGLPEDVDVEVISLQYDGDHEREVMDHGDRRVAISGLNNRDDLRSVFALIRCCDVVITVDNAVAHFASAVGVPTAVLVSAAQAQFRWKNPALKRLFFPDVQLFLQKKSGDWSDQVSAAWQYALSVAGQSGSRAPT